MGTTAEKLTYLNETKTQLKDMLNLGGASLTTEPFRQYVDTLKNRYLYFMNNGTQEVWDNWEKVVGEGTTITLNNTEEAPMKINLKGNTSQATSVSLPNPYFPIPINVVSGDNSIKVEGKNLFDGILEIGGLNTGDGTNNNTIVNAVRSQNYVPVYQNTTYTLYSVNNYKNFILYYDTTKSFISFVANNVSINTFTTPSNCQYIRFATYISQNVTDTTTKFQLELGNQATTYQEYKCASYPINLGDIELCKIGDYQDSIKKSTGKNLFDKNNEEQIKNWFVTNNKIEARNGTTLFFVKCDPSTQYTISKISSTRLQFWCSVEKPAIGVATSDALNNDYNFTGTTKTITTTSDAQWLICYYYNANSDTKTEQEIRDSIQIEKGNQATPYEPYGTVWYLNKQIGKVVLNGSENWSKSSSSTNDIFVGNNVLSTNASLTNRASSISNYFTYNQSITITNKFYITDNKKTIAIVFTAYGNTTLEQFITWISTHNTSVYYILETPTYTEITDSTLLSQLNDLWENAISYKAQTNITQTNNDLPFIISATALREMS